MGTHDISGGPLLYEMTDYRLLGRSAERTMNGDKGTGSDPIIGGLELPYLKQVSKIKHHILEKYLPPWARILGARGAPLCYVDCFAGPGRYRDRDGNVLDGSPVVAVRAAKQYCAAEAGRHMYVLLTEKDPKHVALLKQNLAPLQPYGHGVDVRLFAEDSTQFVPTLLAALTSGIPTFFMVDPYGNPLALPVIREILKRPKTEVLINLMYFSINMRLGNPRAQGRLDELFDHSEWRDQPFINLTGVKREQAFLDYFCSQLKAKYVFPFKIIMDKVEDRVPGDRTKYYLLHARNNQSAVLLMKEVMWKLGDEEGTFDYSGTSQGFLISRTPQDEELLAILREQFRNRRVSFDDIREETWRLPFIEKHYRKVIQELRRNDLVDVTPVDSKTDRGLTGRDIVWFRAV